MNDLAELAARVEQATGEDAYLDLDIYKAVDPDGLGHLATLTDAPNYCASLDAAMTLVPEGYCFSARKDFGGCIAFVWRDIATGVRGEAATPALAMCSAALRARQSGDVK